MFARIGVFSAVFALVFGLALVSWLSFANSSREGKAATTRSDSGGDKGSGKVMGDGNDSEPNHDKESSLVKLSDEQIEATKISVSPVGGGKIVRHLAVAGTIAMDCDRIGRIAANVAGTIIELRKKLGDAVQKGEVVAVLESREVAEARGEYLSSLVSYQLQSTLFERDRSLWQKQVMAEQQYLKTRSAFTEARVRVDLAKQKLLALKLSNQEIDLLARQASAAVEANGAALTPEETTKSLRRYELHALSSGRVVERKVDLGAPVGKDGQEAEIYVIADLAKVWVDLSVPTADLGKVKEGQTVTIKGNISSQRTSGKIIFISPMLSKETRAARVIAEIDNHASLWHPGSFVTAEVEVDEKAVAARVPRTAIQTSNGENAVFVRTVDGFEKRDITIGQQDGDNAEVVSGLDAGELIAVSNTFALKAELGKAAAEDSD